MNTKTILGGLFSSSEPAQRAAMRAAVLKAQQAITRVLSGAAIEAPNTSSTELLYKVDRTAGVVLVDGDPFAVDAADDEGLVGGTPDIDCYDLDGEAAALLDDPGQSQAFAIVAYRGDDGDLAQVGIFGPVAADYAVASPPTAEECREVMRLAGLAWDGINGLIIGRGVFGLASKATITIGAGTVENDQFEVTVDDISSSTTAGAEDDEEDVAGDLVSELTTDLAALPLTVGGAGANITLLFDPGEEPPVIDLDNGASAAEMSIVYEGVIWQTIVSASADIDLVGERAAGSLFA